MLQKVIRLLEALPRLYKPSKPLKQSNRRKMGMMPPEIAEWIPDLPEELGLECLTRLPYWAHPVASRVCRPWRSLVQSKHFYDHRKHHGYTRKVACLVQQHQTHTHTTTSNDDTTKSNTAYGITVFDLVSGTWERLDPIPKYPKGVPMFCQLGSCQGKLVVMGGWDPVTYNPVTDVFVYEFTTRRWRKGREMPSRRSFFAIGSKGGKVYVAGGHDESKNALSSAWVYDARLDEWTELTRMSSERDECHGVVVGDDFWVVSGYGTASQGAFEGGAEVLDVGSGRWRRLEGAWEEGQCPRACGGEREGRLVSWAGLGPGVRVGTRGVDLGSRVLVMGSEYEGGSQGIFVKEGQNGKLDRVTVPQDFSGFVQSGCCVEI